MLNKHNYNIAISHKHTLVNSHSFRQGSQIISTLVLITSCLTIVSTTYENIQLVFVAQATKLYMFLSMHNPTSYHHVVRTLHDGLDSLCAHRSLHHLKESTNGLKTNS